MTVQDVYQRVCSRFLEPYPPGLQSGIFTLQDFLNHVSTVVPDFYERTGCVQMIVTGAVHFGLSVYQVPDQISHISNVFVSGRLLRRTNLQELNAGVYQWRTKTGIPKSFLEDGLPVKEVQIYPMPNYEGQAIPQDGSVPIITPPETNEPMAVGDFWATWRDYSLVGSQVPLDADLNPIATYTLDTPLTGIPDSAVPYISWGVLAKMFSDDSEAKDEARARYCSSRYEEGISIFKAILDEKTFNEPDNSL